MVLLDAQPWAGWRIPTVFLDVLPDWVRGFSGSTRKDGVRVGLPPVRGRGNDPLIARIDANYLGCAWCLLTRNLGLTGWRFPAVFLEVLPDWAER